MPVELLYISIENILYHHLKIKQKHCCRRHSSNHPSRYDHGKDSRMVKDQKHQQGAANASSHIGPCTGRKILAVHSLIYPKDNLGQQKRRQELAKPVHIPA